LHQEEHPFDPKPIFSRFRLFYPPQELEPLTLEGVVKMKDPSLRKRYRRAVLKLRAQGLDERDAKVSMFVKHERMSYPNGDVTSDVLKPPRAIQARSAKFNLAAQKYIVPYMKHWFARRRTHHRTPFAVGLDPKQIAAQLLRDWRQFQDPVALLVDHERWDSCLNTKWLKSEHRYYNDHFKCRQLRRLLKQQLNNKCRTRTGLRYRIKATRCSGDCNTSSGNCTCNLALLTDLFRRVKHASTVMGDDGVVIFDRKDLPTIQKRLDRSRERYPWKTAKSFAFVFEQIEFCQCRPVYTVNGYLMVRHPNRVITRGLTCISQTVVQQPRLFYDWLRAVGDCEYSVNPGVPILQSVASYFRSFSNRAIHEPHDRSRFKTLRGHYDRTIVREARLSFHKAYGVSPALQLAIEKWFDTHCGLRHEQLVDIHHPVDGLYSNILLQPNAT
jgi:hypothetical protein